MPTDAEKYGETIREDFANKDSLMPFRIAIVKYRDELWLDIRRMWYNKQQMLQFGKGVRIPIDDDIAENVLKVAGAMMEQYVLTE